VVPVAAFLNDLYARQNIGCVGRLLKRCGRGAPAVNSSRLALGLGSGCGSRVEVEGEVVAAASFHGGPQR
jgi:hypothetical protein